MTKNEQSPPTLPILIKEEIIKDIMTGVIRPRDKIVEEVYAKRMDASRASVREAIYLLMGDGIVTKVEKKGTFLNSYTLEEHIDLYTLRFFLEREAIKKVEKMDDVSGLIHVLKELSAQMKQHLEEVHHLSLLNYKFHYEFVKSSNSRVLIERYPSFFVTIAFLQNQAYNQHRANIQKPIFEHDLIIEALEANDFPKLYEILDGHHQDVINLLNSTLIIG